VRGAGALQERTVDQARHRVDHAELVDRFVGGDSACGTEIELGREHRQPIEHGTLGGVAQVVRPVECASHGLVALHPRPTAADQQPEPFVEVLEDLDRRQGAKPCRRQLDRQGEPVEAQTDRLDGCGLGVVEDQLRCLGPGSVHEHLDRLVGLQRRHGDQLLAGDHQRFATGGEHGHLGTCGDDAFDRLGGLGEHVFAVVDHEQSSLMTNPTDDVIDHIAAFGGPHAEAGRDRERDRLRRGDDGQLDEPATVGVSRCELGRRSGGEAGLAGATDADQGDEAVVAQPIDDPGDLAAPADEVGQLGRQVALELQRGPQRRERPVADLEDLFGFVEPLQPVLAQLGRSDVGCQRGGRRRDQDLAAVAGVHDAGDPVE
jgi:hypothetical protein